MAAFRSLWLILLQLLFICVLAQHEELHDQGCSIPESFPHGSMILDEEEYLYPDKGIRWVRRGSILEFRCEQEYKLIGPDFTICLGKEQWDKSFPMCYKKTCESTPDLPHGNWMGIRRVPGAIIRATCNDGYKLRDPEVSTLKCQRVNITDVEWSGVLPYCDEIAYCTEPGTPPKGTGVRIPAIGPYYEGLEISYSCSEGYELIGSRSVICGKDGKWNSERPRCKPNITCPDLPLDQNGYLTIKSDVSTDFFKPYDEVELVCNPGYQPNSSNSWVICFDDGTWDADLTSCRVTVCTRPHLMKSSYIEVSEDLEIYPHNATIRIRCPPGYQLLGTNWNQCTDDGWKFSFPQCREITCPDPGMPEDGIRYGPSVKFPINSKVTFKCFGGYTMSGSKRRTCLSNGQWDGTLTTCSLMNEGCENPGTPINGHRFGQNFSTGNVINFQCSPGFTMIGSKERTCLPNGLWGGQETLCRGALEFDRAEDVKFRLIYDLDTKMALKDSKQREGHPASLWNFQPQLNSGDHQVFYFVFDSSENVGNANFKTSIDFAKAVVKRVGVSSTVHVGSVTYGRSVRRDLYPLGLESEELVLKRLSDMEYIGGGSSLSPALKVVRDLVSTVRSFISDESTVTSTVYIITDGVYNVGGNPENVATELKRAGVEIFVVGLVGLRKASLESIQSIATSPKHVYYSDGFETLEYLVDTLINNTIDYSRCGISVRDNTDPRTRHYWGKDTVIHWPWMAHLSFAINASSMVYCGGSVIDKMWILSAASCLENVLPGNITVLLGALNEEVGEKGDHQTHYVERFWIHPKSSNLGYDVAVLKLKKPATFGKNVRRICLPPETRAIPPGSTLYRVGESLTAIGWSVMEPYNASSDSLKEKELFLQERKQCEENILRQKTDSIHKKINGMLCASDVNGMDGPFVDGSGSPLMQRLEDGSDLNEPYWVQIGVASGYTKSNLKNEEDMGFYTNLATVVPWVLEVVSGKHR